VVRTGQTGFADEYPGHPSDMNVGTAHATSREPPTLVFVSRRHCGVSRRMASLVAWVKITKKKRLRVVDLDADLRPELAHHLGVRETPSLLLLAGGKVVGRLDGRSTGRQIEALIDPHLGERSSLMAATDDPLDTDDVGYGASREGEQGDAPEQARQEEREPASDEEAEQDNYANTDESKSSTRAY
jgi:thioredoxin 1